MDPVLHTAFALAATAASALVAATWQGAVLAIAVLLGLRLVPSASAAARSLLWTGAFVLVVLLHFLPFLPHTRWQGPSGPGANGMVQVGPLWALGLGCLWLALSGYRAWLLGLSAARLHGIARRAREASPEVIQALSHLVSQALSANALRAGFIHPSGWRSRRVAICTSTEVDRPCVVGLLSPRILMPPALLAELSAPELEQIILHELEHLRRADHWTNLVQKLVLVLFPLNPVLLWIEHRLCAERELACDDQVLRQTRARKVYAGCLARLAEHSLVARGASLALGAWERQSELSRRVYRILLQPQASSVGTRRTTVATALLFLGLVTGFLELSQAPSVISFAGNPASAQLSLAALAGRPAGGAELPAAQLPAAQLPAAQLPAAQVRAARVRVAQAGLPQARLVNALWSPPAARSIVFERPARPLRTATRRTTCLSQWIMASPVQSPTSPAAMRRVASSRMEASTMMLLTRQELTQHQDSEPRRLLRVSQMEHNLWPTYAIVPVADGWLIFPLNYPISSPLNYQL